ncbi:MAG TPA: hypothetical protein VKZ53_16075 [Candidatus Angelobacter sp.]|nr:hypothetical protein [Candidatus Angelobacter sp.]
MEKHLLAQLEDSPRPGLCKLEQTITIAQALGVSADWVWAVLRRHRIGLQRRRSWCISTDSEFTRKAADLVGLYLHPPENAVVLSADEKPQFRPRSGHRGGCSCLTARPSPDFSPEYKQNGTFTLFAARKVATGEVQAGHFQRR